MGGGSILPTLGSAQDFLPIDASSTYHTQIDFDTDMEEETGTAQSKGNKKRVLMKLKASSSSFRRENLRNEASSGKDIARALAKLSPGGMPEFVQHVPASVAALSYGLLLNHFRYGCGRMNRNHRMKQAQGVGQRQSNPAAAPSGTETEFSDAQFCGAVALPSGSETEFEDAQFCGAVAVPYRIETELSDAQFPVCRGGAGKGDARHLSRGALVPQRQRQGRRAASGFVAGSGQQARCGRAEAGVLVLHQMCYSLDVSRIHLHELHGLTLHSIILCLTHRSSIPAHD